MSESIAASYLMHASKLLERVAAGQHESISAAAEAVAETLVADGLVHVFGSGHSHMLALEGFYRAGGLAALNPILIESLMLHGNAALSTRLESAEGVGSAVYADLAPGASDCFILVSNSGSNRVAIELAQAARAAGQAVIAIVSVDHARARSVQAGQAAQQSLLDLADVVIDNLGEPGDAAIAVDGIESNMGPTSSVTGTAIMNAIAIEAASIAVQRGTVPDVFFSSNLAGGDERNTAAIMRYRGRVRAL